MSVWKKMKHNIKTVTVYFRYRLLFWHICKNVYIYHTQKERAVCLLLYHFFAEVVCNDFIYILSCLFTTLAEMLLSYIYTTYRIKNTHSSITS